MLVLHAVTWLGRSAAVAAELTVASVLLWRKNRSLRKVSLQMGAANLRLKPPDLSEHPAQPFGSNRLVCE